MQSLTWLFTAILGLLCISFAVVDSKEVKAIEEKLLFHNKDVIFNGQPLKNDTLLFANCDIADRFDFMNCSVHLLSYPAAEKVDTKVCKVSRQPPDNFMVGLFRLELLSSDQVLFMWFERLRGDHELEVHQLYYRTVNMTDCQFVEHKIEFEIGFLNGWAVREVLVVPYQDSYGPSFDLLFRNKSLCGNYWCRQFHDKGGRVLGAPVASYFKNEEMFVVSPVKSRSLALGYFMFSTELRLVGWNKGEYKQLVNFMPDVNVWTSNGDNDYLGYCWMLRSNGKQLNCTQFDSQGKQTLQFLLKQKQDSIRKFDSWLALSNLRDGGMLLLTSDCDNSTDCLANLNKTQFNAYKVQKVGDDVRVEHLHRFTNIHCNGFERGVSQGIKGFSEGIKTEIHEQENGGVCLSLACKRRDNKEDTEIYLTSKCISVPESERGPSIQEQKECSDLNCHPEVLSPYKPSDRMRFYEY